MQKRGRNKLAQASVEYLMVAGLAFAIIVPMIYVFYTYSMDISQQVTESKVSSIANNLVNAAEEVFYLGEPSKTTIRTEIPQGIFDVYVSPNKRELVFNVGDIYKYTEIVGYSNVNLKSYLIPQDVVAGSRNIKVEAKSDYAIIYTGNLLDAIPAWCSHSIASQIIRNAAKVNGDRKSRAATLYMPVDCIINDISLPELKKILVNLDVDGVPTEITTDSPVPVKEDGEGTLRTEDHTYDFLYKPAYVLISEPDCRDDDGDHYGSVMGSTKCGDLYGDEYDKYDCDDANTVINPGAAEVCGDGKDNNCDGTIDEGCVCTAGDTQPCGSNIGECRQGTQTCTGGAWGSCVGEVTPQPEVCTGGLDEDCDGLTDCADPDCAGDVSCPVSAALTCTYDTTPCSSPYIEVLRASDTIDAHASLPEQGSFANYICCNIEGATLRTTCTLQQASFLQLSDTGVDAHVQEYNPAMTGFTNNACLSSSSGTISCDYFNNIDDCSAYGTCLASISDATDAHIGDCNAYTTKVCCKATS